MTTTESTQYLAPGEYSDTEYVFAPHVAELPPLGEYVDSIWRRRALISWLVKTETRSRVSNTTLGNLWEILDPLLQAGIYFFLYMVLRGGERADFLPVLIASVFLFGLSTSALTKGSAAMSRSKTLVLSSSFPRALLPISVVYDDLASFLPRAGVLAVLFPMLGGAIGPGLLVLPLLFVIQMVMNVGIALFTTTLVILVRDGGKFLPYVTRMLFFLTPIIYPLDLIPPIGRVVLSAQPLFPLFSAYQQIFLGQMPSVGSVVLAVGWAAVAIVVGSRWFLRNERQFAMHL